MKTFFKRTFSYLGAGLEDGIDKSLKVMGYGAASVVLVALIEYLSNFRINGEFGSIGYAVAAYAINILLVFLKKWLFTVQSKSVEVTTTASQTVEV